MEENTKKTAVESYEAKGRKGVRKEIREGLTEKRE